MSVISALSAPARPAKGISQRSIEALVAGQRLWDDKLPGFCVRCQGRSKTFGLQVRIRGKQRMITLGKWGVLTPDEARREARQLLGRLAAGEDIAAQRERMKALPTVDELAEMFIRQHVATKLKPRTAAEYERLLRTCIMSKVMANSPTKPRGRPSRKCKDRPRLGSLRVDAVTTADVSHVHNGLSDVPYEANRAMAVLSKLMSFAEQQGARPRGFNPCQGIAKFKEHRRERFLSMRELAKLSEAMDVLEGSGRVSLFAMAAIRLLLLTGARREEIRMLHWSFIDAERGLAFLPDSKTGRKTLHLSPVAMQLLSSLPRIQDNPFVFPGSGSEGRGKSRGQPIRDLQAPWERVRVLAGFPEVRLHDLRHSYASLLAASGTPLVVIGKLLGHRHVATTARYAHLADDPLRIASARIGARLAELFTMKLAPNRPDANSR